MAANRSYSAAHFALELDQKEIAGFFRSVEGGGVKADIASYRMGSNHALWRQLGKPKYEDVKIQVGMAMSESFYDWIESFFSGKVVRKNGAILAGDFHYKERARREMYEVLISEVTIPKLDGSDRNACYMNVTLVPEQIRFQPGSMRDLQSYSGGSKQKLWTPNNFTFKIDGLESACRRVTRIDSFTIKQQIMSYEAGNLRDALRVPGIVEFPNLTFYVPEADSKSFLDHFTKYVINGEKQPDARHNGEITLLDHELNDLCSVSLFGVDIANVSPERMDATSEDMKLMKVEISVERMEFKYTGSATG
jgi:phage tail-like protein